MKYTMHCPVEDCGHVMRVEAADDDAAVAELMVKGNEHFAEVGHAVDASMTPEMQEQMTRQYMKREMAEEAMS